MRQAVTQIAGLAARGVLVVYFTAHVVRHVWPGALGTTGIGVETGTRVLDIAAAVFFALVALWLILGIYSRVVAITGMVVCGAAHLLFGAPVSPHALAVAVAAVLVLSFAGGGRLRLYAGGWRLRGCL